MIIVTKDISWLPKLFNKECVDSMIICNEVMAVMTDSTVIANGSSRLFPTRYLFVSHITIPDIRSMALSTRLDIIGNDPDNTNIISLAINNRVLLARLI